MSSKSRHSRHWHPRNDGAPLGSEQQDYRTKGLGGNRCPDAAQLPPGWVQSDHEHPKAQPQAAPAALQRQGCRQAVPLATFRGGRGGALVVLGAAGWLGGGLPLRMAPYVSFCKMLGTKLLCLSLARPVTSLAKDAALDGSWLEPSW